MVVFLKEFGIFQGKIAIISNYSRTILLMCVLHLRTQSTE